MHELERPERLSRVFDYAEDRAAFLDVRDAVAAVLDDCDPADESDSCAELVILAMRPVMERTLTRRLATEPRIRELVASVMVTAVLP